MPGQSPFLQSVNPSRLAPQVTGGGFIKKKSSSSLSSSSNHNHQHSGIPKQQIQRQSSKKENGGSNSISKKFFHLTRKIGNGLSSSSNKYANEKLLSSKNKKDGNPVLPQSKSRSNFKADLMFSGKKSTAKLVPRQPHTHSNSYSSKENRMRNYQSDDEHESIPNNSTASTHDASYTDDLSTVPSDEYLMKSPPQSGGFAHLQYHNREERYIPHSFKAGKHTFTVDSKYSLIRVIGSGAYGVVISAHDQKTDGKVAIKMVPKAFHDEIDAKRILREIKLLKHFKHENIISILDMMPPMTRNVEGFNDVYICTDLMETDLHRIIYSKQSISIDHVQYFVYQILRALKYIHSANVLHRDLKPSNLLVNSNCDLKICDFGLARGIHSDDVMMDKHMGGSMLLTEYVVTRWYRAPEIMLSCHEYTKPIDLWSVGCIFAELLSRKPYFPGEDYIDQLTIITQKLGKVPEEDLDFVTSEKAKRFMRKLPDKPVVSLRRQFPGTPPDALDLLSKLLQIHPGKRITVEDALVHPFLASLHNPRDEPVADTPFDFGFENQDLYRVRLQELIWEEVGSFRPSCLPVAPRKTSSSSSRGPKERRAYEA